MKFKLYQDIIKRLGTPGVWVESGEYPVVRLLDGNRVVINISKEPEVRLLTLVSCSKGVLTFS